MTLLSCDNITDATPLEELQGLKSLKMEFTNDCPVPDLGKLSGLEKLYIEKYGEINCLAGMTSLQELVLVGCHVGSTAGLEELVNLKNLTCTASASPELDYGYITKFPALEVLSMRKSNTYQDISGIFNIPTLKSLDISGAQCEISFNQVNENTNLEVLKMDGLKLYTNVSVQSEGFITYTDWDEVVFKDYVDFLLKFPNVKELSLKSNSLTELNFTSQLNSLEKIDFGDNYVTDLAPLAGLPKLQEIKCENNPITNTMVLPDSVAVIQ